MTLPYFHISQHTGTVAEGERCALMLAEAVHHHLMVLRLKVGERFILVDSQGVAITFELLKPLTHDTQIVELRLCSRSILEQRPFLTLVQGISAHDRMDQTLRQTTELGVSRIIPLESDRCTVRLKGDNRQKKHDRWLRVARAAADQSARGFVPEVERPLKLSDALSAVADHDCILVAWEECKGQGIREALASVFAEDTHVPQVALFIGPEGGFDVSEIEVMKTQGARIVNLGSNILRTETAAVVATALVLHELGELGNRPLLKTNE